MNSGIEKRKPLDGGTFLSVLWLFASLNYLYCDVIGLMDSNLLNQYVTGVVNGMSLTEMFFILRFDFDGNTDGHDRSVQDIALQAQSYT